MRPDNTSPGPIVATRTFDLAAAQRFAQISGDWNPIHLDGAVARRTQYGAPIVHGAHFVLWALDAFAARGERRVARRMSVRFTSALYAGEEAAIRLVRSDGDRLRLGVEVEGVSIASINIECSSEVAQPYVLPAGSNADEPVPPVVSEDDFSRVALMHGSIDIAARIGATAHAFPAAAAWLGPERVAALAAFSRVVGMECPGLHSVFAGFATDLCERVDGSELTYRVVSADAQLRVIRLRVEGAGVGGDIEAFMRRAPTPQVTSSAVAQRVRANEFIGQVVLVVGGSRGLGEVTAKIAAAGGARVVITYVNGKADAQRVAAEIVEAGGACSLLRYDVLEPAGPQLASLDEPAHSAYYFATGPIFDRKLRSYDAERFQRFCRYYVDGFEDVCTGLAARSSGRISILYPSSVAVERPPRALLEYAMAKAAGEVLCEELGRSPSRLDILVHRLPRVLTDQTATIKAIAAEDALSVMLPLVRTIQAGSATARK